MSKNLFITGTDTDVGKTFVTALIVKKMRELQKKVGYYKVAASGNDIIDGVLTAGDALHVKNIANLEEKPNDMVSYIYKNAYSPHLAAQIEGNPPEINKIRADFLKNTQKYDFLTLEGSGGILCPLRIDEFSKIWLLDIVKMFDLPVVIVSNSGLGAINGCGLTVSYLKQNNVKIKGIILNNFELHSQIHNDNKKIIENTFEIPILTTVESNAENIEIDEIEALYE